MRKLSSIVLVFALASCAPKAADTTGRRPQSDYLRRPVTQFASVKDAYDTYRSGIANIMETVPGDPDGSSGPSRRLNEYKSIYKQLGWSRIDRDNRIYALTPGRVPGYWVSFIEPDHPGLKTRGSMLHVELNERKFVSVIVRPDKITARWAGIFLVHELSHAREDLEKGGPDGDASECSAYDLEKTAYSHVTGNAFDGALDEVLNAHAIEDAKELLGQGAVRISGQLQEIDQKMNEEPGQSSAEMEMRHGFYLMAMVLRLSERAGDDAGAKVKKVNEAIANYSMFDKKGNPGSNP
jgi:hypothetical protein